MVNTDKAMFYYKNTIYKFVHSQTQPLHIIYIQSTKEILPVTELLEVNYPLFTSNGLSIKAITHN